MLLQYFVSFFLSICSITFVSFFLSFFLSRFLSIFTSFSVFFLFQSSFPFHFVFFSFVCFLQPSILRSSTLFTNFLMASSWISYQNVKFVFAESCIIHRRSKYRTYHLSWKMRWSDKWVQWNGSHKEGAGRVLSVCRLSTFPFLFYSLLFLFYLFLFATLWKNKSFRHLLYRFFHIWTRTFTFVF